MMRTSTAIAGSKNALRGCFLYAPVQGASPGWAVPRVETLGFYEADFVKTRRENYFLFIFLHFNPSLNNNPPFSFWCLVVAVRGTSAAMIKRQKPVTLRARNVVGSRRATE
jgi:hypothetical protein